MSLPELRGLPSEFTSSLVPFTSDSVLHSCYATSLSRSSLDFPLAVICSCDLMIPGLQNRAL
jgi:hypothetical protein